MTLTLLFIQARRRVGLLNAFRKELQRRSISGRLLTTDTNDLDPISYVSDEAWQLPAGEHPQFSTRLLELCRREKVDCVVPWQDADLLPLAQCRELIEDAGTKVLLSPIETIKIGNDKKIASELIKQASSFAGMDQLHVPEIVEFVDLEKAGVLTGELPNLQSALGFPLMAKPLDGAGSVNCFRCDDQQELSVAIKKIGLTKAFVQSFIDGPEFTVDCFAGANGKLISTCVRERLKTRGGEVLTSKTVADPFLLAAAEHLSSLVEFVGPFNFQVIKNDKGYWFTEFNPRFSGGATLSIEAGWNAPGWIIDLLQGNELIPPDQIQTGLHVLRYHEEVCIREEDLLSRKGNAFNEQF